MKKYGSIPTALAFIGFCAVAVVCFLFIRDFVNKRENQARIDEANEVGKLADIRVTINGKSYTAISYNSKATQILLEELPIDLEMDTEGNFKVGFTYFKLPIEHAKMKTIKMGDIIIIDDSHIAIAAKNFDTDERYTLVGHIENLDSIPGGRLTVSFMKIE